MINRTKNKLPSLKRIQTKGLLLSFEQSKKESKKEKVEPERFHFLFFALFFVWLLQCDMKQYKICHAAIN